MNKAALITGITGQDGAYLSDSSSLTRVIQQLRAIRLRPYFPV